MIDLELRTIVDAMCLDAAVRSGMGEAAAQITFGHWLGQQDPEIGNEELALVGGAVGHMTARSQAAFALNHPNKE